MAFEDLNKLVLDIGSFRVRAGIAGDDEPRINFPTMISPNPQSKLNESSSFNNENISNSNSSDGDEYLKKEYLVGREIIDYEMKFGGKLEISSPFDGKEIVDFDSLERIWKFIYGELKMDSEECPIVMIEHALTAKRERETKMQIMFESFNVPMYYSAYDSVMSMYASGRTCGITVNMGYEETQIVPIFEGFALPHAIKTMKFGGRQLTEYLSRKLTLNSHLNLTNDQVSQMKEKLCYVAEDFDDELTRVENASFELPDGNTIQIAQERLTCPEIYFKPSILSSDHEQVDPIHNQTYNSICKCDIDGRRFWYSNILLTGASSCFPKMTERMTKEMVFLSPSSMKVKVIGAPERNNFAWLGGSILGSLSVAQTMFITLEEYDEFGPVIVNRKCF